MPIEKEIHDEVVGGEAKDGHSRRTRQKKALHLLGLEGKGRKRLRSEM